MQTHDSVLDAAEAVATDYASFTTDNEEGRRQLALMTSQIRGWFDGRRLSEQAEYCIDKFVASEVDYTTPGMRGLGRIGENVPRLAARHRGTVARMTDEEREALKRFIRRHVVCGYLFTEFAYGLTDESRQQVGANKLFEMWVLTIYSSSSLVRMNPRNKDEDDVRTIWFGSTGRSVRDTLQSRGATWQDLDMHIVTHYFDGGMRLRALEARPLTPEQELNIATGGAYTRELADAHKARIAAKGSGCSLLLGFVVLAGSLAAAAFLL